MCDFYPYFTADGSVGLYNSDYDDIYHSATGALTEAFEKFIYPVNLKELISRSDSLKVLDICYGIGYNSKSFLNYYFDNLFKINFKKNFKSKFSKKYISKKIDIDTIYTNNINTSQTRILCEYNNSIYTNNIDNFTLSKNSQLNEQYYTSSIDTDKNLMIKNKSIYIKAIDTDKILAYLSPFIKTGVKNIGVQKLEFNYQKINKFLNSDIKIEHKKINKIINLFLLEKILKNNDTLSSIQIVNNILFSDKYDSFFERDIKAVYRDIINSSNTNNIYLNKYANLHNIYYRNIAKSYKTRLKSYLLQHIDFDLEIADARQVLLEDNNLYDLIFLDAFSPSKCPCLWSYEFFKELYNHTNCNGVLLTYSSSAAVRAAMLEAGFHVGKIFNSRLNTFTGTICSKNINNIKYKLSEYDLGLLKTKSGIMYRDKNLNAVNEAIIAFRKNEVANSNRMSCSHYIKSYNQEELCNTM